MLARAAAKQYAYTQFLVIAASILIVAAARRPWVSRYPARCALFKPVYCCLMGSLPCHPLRDETYAMDGHRAAMACLSNL